MPRNSSGVYQLPAGNPVVSGTLIESTWANSTMSDMAQALSDSLDRFGRSTMAAPLLLNDGTVAAPGMAFGAESSTGLYRESSHVMGVSVAGVEVARFTSAGISALFPMLFADGTLAAPGIAFGAETGTGFYRPAANTLGVAVGGQAVAQFTQAGFSGLDGTLALPSIGFTSDTNTGFWHPGADLLAAVTNGIEAWRVTASQQLLIGSTAAPMGTALLQVNGAAAFVPLGTALDGIYGYSQSTDTFTYDTNKTLHEHGLTWKSFSDATGGGTAALSGFKGVRIFVNAALAARFDPGGNFTATGMMLSGAAEGLRLFGATPFLSFYNAGQTTRTGFVQGDSANGLFLNADIGDLIFNRHGTEAARFTASGLQMAAQSGVAFVGLNDATKYLAVSAGSAVGNFARLELAGASNASTPNQAFLRGDIVTFTNSAAALMAALTPFANGGTLVVGAPTSPTSAANRGVIESVGSTDSVVSLRVGATTKGYLYATGPSLALNSLNVPISLQYNSTEIARVDTDSTFKYSGTEVGWRDMPTTNPALPYTLQLSDRGKLTVLGATGTVSYSGATGFPGGCVLTLYNNSGGNCTLQATNGAQLRWGTGTPSNASRTIANCGLVTLVPITSTVVQVTGTGLS